MSKIAFSSFILHTRLLLLSCFVKSEEALEASCDEHKFSFSPLLDNAGK